jgi:hypothetical protein
MGARRRSYHTIFAVVSLAAASACGVLPSADIGNVELAATASLQAAAPPLLIPKTENARWDDLTSPGRVISGFETIMDCGRGLNQTNPVVPIIQNYTAKLTDSTGRATTPEMVGWEALNDSGFLRFTSIQFTGNGQSQVFHCQLMSPTYEQWASAHPGFIGPNQGTLYNPNGIAIILAQRTNVTYTYANRYEADIEGKGKVPVIALQFTYQLTPTLPNVRAAALGVGSAKAILDSDSGKWTFIDFQYTDPDLTYDSKPVGVAQIDPLPVASVAAPPVSPPTPAAPTPVVPIEPSPVVNSSTAGGVPCAGHLRTLGPASSGDEIFVMVPKGATSIHMQSAHGHFTACSWRNPASCFTSGAPFDDIEVVKNLDEAPISDIVCQGLH